MPSEVLNCTRWQEVKLGRVFSAIASASASADPALTWQMSDSAYLAQRGPYAGFTTRFERLVPPTSTRAQPLVFVTDGAPWMHH